MADEYNQVIRKITPAGVVSTLSGSGNEGYLNGTSANADFFFPADVALDGAGNFYVAEYGNRDIRKIGTDGTVSLLAGTPRTAGLTDGVGAAASFNIIEGVTIGIDGNVYVPDWGNDNIREIILGGYSISPALPAGLAFDKVSGSISGTPTVVSASTSYAVITRNLSGAPTTPLQMAVVPPAGFNPSQDHNYVITFMPRVPNITNNTALSNDMNQVEIGIQYFDGLGRPLQTVQVKGSSMGNDVVQPIAYDAFGREPTKYLPYALTGATANDGSYKTDALTPMAGQAQFYVTPPFGVSPITTPQAGTAFEPSPLNRVLEQGAPGDAWQLTGTAVITPNTISGHTVKTIYANNDGTTYWANQYGVNIDANGTRTLTFQGAYGANQLYVTVSQNENWLSTQTVPNTINDPRLNTVEEYKDKKGHVLLKRTYNYNTSTSLVEVLSTYYVYDPFDNLAFVLTPGANPDNSTGLTSASNQTTLNNLCYQYGYDERNRMVAKQLPGKGVEEMVYNLLDRLVFDRDANKRAHGQWGFMKYDALGRVIMTGITVDTSSRVPLQNFVSYQLGVGTYAEWETASPGSATQGYTNNAFPFGSNVIPLVVNYYDDYTFQGRPVTVASPGGASARTRGLPTATKTAVLNTISNPATLPDMLWKVKYYDDLGRLIQSYAQHYLGGVLSPYNYDVVSSTYDFTNIPTTTIRRHFNTSNTTIPIITTSNQYIYDHTGRKLKTWEQITNGTTPTPRTLLSQVVYNELGQVVTKQLHSIDSINFLQNIAFAYNERGWLLNNSGPLFEEQLQYNNVAGINGIAPIAQYNGNIASQSWGTSTAPNGKSYSYVYDNLNRLLSGISIDHNDETGITYDYLGNITALNRYQANTLIDQLSYSYTDNNGNRSNQVQGINDLSPDTSLYGYRPGNYTGYQYDGNGNMIVMPTPPDGTALANINVQYNLLNLPQTFTGGRTITYYYDALGNKLRKVNPITGNTDYIEGIQYDKATGASAPTISFIQTEEGKAMPTSSGGYDYNYYLSDHLGNTRVTFDTKNGSAAVLQQDDYYPFGYEIKRIISSPKTEYLYNKKELQEEIVQYDYNARFYDPVVARWTSMDLLGENNRRVSPYNYGENNPIRNIDPDGMENQVIDGYGTTSDQLNNLYGIGSVPASDAPNAPSANAPVANSGSTNPDAATKKTNNNSSGGGVVIVANNGVFIVPIPALNSYTTIAIKGNFSLDNVAIGYQQAAMVTATLGTGYSGNAYVQHTLFLGGPFKGQWFDYVGIEGQAVFESSAEISVGVAKSYFIAINNPKMSFANNPKDFAGPYSGWGLAASYKPLVGDGNVGFQYSKSSDNAWQVFSLGYSIAIGPSGGVIVGGSVGLELHWGKTWLLPGQQINTTKNTSWGHIALNWFTHTLVP
ncbi:DUF6443 domain-containing protein [Mucilaginibacter frigoritolerans]|uniref:DUF6443 domain-containing protein n=1 Tax=Mucilaginibacter frigoritolerans TaxID=652788 RepID=UPI001B87B032|nr:DUF6443 domain-containing protein [Mucilaginibacter frigoritolerans]